MATEEESVITRTHIEASERLIFALDVANLAEARGLVEQLKGVVSFYKIGIELFVSSGLAFVPELIQAGNKVFLDLKYYDVPATVQKAVEQIASLGVSFLTIHGNGKILEAAVAGRGNADLQLLSVTVLTSLDDDDMRDLGFTCTVKDLVARRAQKALEAGCDGVITSPEEVELIKKLAVEIKGANHKFLIVTPGVRPPGAPRDDHKRPGSPEDAIKSGADYLVIGRPIRMAADPRQTAKDIIAEMQSAFDAVENA